MKRMDIYKVDFFRNYKIFYGFKIYMFFYFFLCVMFEID